MSTTQRIVAFVAALVAVFGLAVFVGRAAGPDVEVDRHEADKHDKGPKKDEGHGEGHDKKKPEKGFRLALTDKAAAPGSAQTVTFRVEERGRAVTAYENRHERDLHLIAVTRDLTDYQHVHPTLGAEGLWSAALRLEPGRYRLYADTQPSGAEPMVLESDLTVSGAERGPQVEPAPSTSDTVGAYQVTMLPTDEGATFSVTKDGRPVTDLEPYLGAFGHLVVIRGGSLDYLHAHPEDGPAGPEVAFGVEFAKPGRHRLFFDFQHQGVVRTADFTVDAPMTPGGGGHDH